MDEKMLCHNVHGHEYITHLTFSFENMQEIGYAIDFKEIKRVFVQFLQDYMDHGMILNPKDTMLINTVQSLGSKLWIMSLNGHEEYCNPSVENVAKEIFLSMDIISNELYKNSPTGLKIHKVLVYETPNCYTEVYRDGITDFERSNFNTVRLDTVTEYAREKGVLEYDRRKLN